MATNGTFNQQDQYKTTATEQYPATSGATGSSSGGASGGDLSKDEVGWYFVEQYYTTLSKSPEKLHLFYGKKSQFVSGLEGAQAPVSVGRAGIQERIRDLDFQDCKVRVTNVDSQSSFDNIVIQVIGETSNKSAEPKKFVQTFVLAQQPTGYFVLNDVFRYINEEVEEEQVEAAEVKEESAPAQIVDDVEMPAAPAAVEESAAPETTLDADVVDKKLEETIETEPATVEPTTNGESAEATTTEVEEKPEEPKVEEKVPTPEEIEKAVDEEVKEPEKPKDPVPTPELSRQPSATKPAPIQPATPAKPLSWAARIAASAGSAPKPAVPVVQPKAAAPAAQKPAATQPAKQPTTPATTAATPAAEKKENSPTGSAGWQTAGGDAKRQNRPQSISQQPTEDKGTLGYVRNVNASVKDEELRSVLSSFGELVYFDINRAKNCAFVEYANAAGYQAAAQANPHKIGEETIYVEPRRPKSTAYGGNGYSGAARGGMNQRPRGGFEQGRPGNQPGRGNFGANRGRGGANGPRGGRSGAGQTA
ncbi:hypothetical protein SS1G_07219 [Sclerotinia sclerotiorum 1980 UF-70]|uniref:NTF2 domain-containing protein n=2 Tax=Sclerotinia sclerotiorum (strain ATCC 18683 / 1980 / Ss-1) TaxID=665079 RepID=A7EPH0_SCLS1|nr:hypothetical protein SS1G_07219 [Sclerotinia sclerotiorum 1980 UF-70]APA10321.1 hypothetical protein sscle_06g050910 [Sclerotinia sclerotiorum 1980 UF-70]EDO04736.1 hypothetical protein SS1G_07219 [Sclerotinia sclerotiorum 1980 UF-70]